MEELCSYWIVVAIHSVGWIERERWLSVQTYTPMGQDS